MAWRNIKANEGRSIPRRLVFFDTETLPTRDNAGPRLTHRLRLGCAERGVIEEGRWTRTQQLNFTTSEEFWDWCLAFGDKRKTTWIVAHSAVFDLTASCFWRLWESGEVTDDRPRSPRKASDGGDSEHGRGGLLVLEDPPTILCFRHVASGARFVVVDTLNYFRRPLATLGEYVGLPKLPMPHFDAHDDDWFTYCRRDCEVLKTCFLGLVKFVRDYHLGNFAKTAPAQAMNAFRHRLMPHKIVTHDRAEIKALERAAYFGGECSMYYQGPLNQTVEQFDVSSLFPSVMLANEFPWRLLRWNHPDAPTADRPSIDPARSIAEVEIESDAETFPTRSAVGVRYKSGANRVVLCGPELAYAVDRGYVRKWGRWAEYATYPLFGEFVAHFWQQRQKFKAAGNSLYDELCKLMLNSLYGKFGQLSGKWTDRPDLIAPQPWSQWQEINLAAKTSTTYRAIGWTVQEAGERQEVDGNFPAIAAFVTSYARQRMRGLRALAGRESVFYQGVDSLIVSKAAGDRLRAAGEVEAFSLGKLRHVATAAAGAIWGKQYYELDGKVTAAGIRATAERIDGQTWQQQRFGGAAALFGHVCPDGVPVDLVRITRKQEGEGQWLSTSTF